MLPPATLPPSLPPSATLSRDYDTASSNASRCHVSTDSSITNEQGSGDNGSRLRKKRPPGATDLALMAAKPPGTSDSGGGSGSADLVNALGTSAIGCLSGVSLSGVLDTPQELKSFASQLSPRLGLTPDAMFDFLATDNVLAQLGQCAAGWGGEAAPSR